MLDEDLGKAQERIGSVLAVDETSAARQNEMLKAAAKQVTDADSRHHANGPMPAVVVVASEVLLMSILQGFDDTRWMSATGLLMSADTRIHVTGS